MQCVMCATLYRLLNHCYAAGDAGVPAAGRKGADAAGVPFTCVWVAKSELPHCLHCCVTQVMQECQQRAEEEPLLLERNWVVAVLVFVLWTTGLLLLVHWLVRQYGDDDLQPYEWAVLAGTGGVAAIVFSVWMISRLRYEARRRDEWNACLLADAGRVL